METTLQLSLYLDETWRFELWYIYYFSSELQIAVAQYLEGACTAATHDRVISFLPFLVGAGGPERNVAGYRTLCNERSKKNEGSHLVSNPNNEMANLHSHEID